MFRFIHAADIHLDSPLRGLERYEGAPVEQVRRATRQALENLVQLAIDSEVAFLLIAGDLYDGDWKDYNTGLFFIAQMARLRELRIPVYVIAGNHDAANKMTKSLRLPENVHMLSAREPESAHIESCGVAIHGQSYATAAVTHDLSAAYPRPVRGAFNIGLLHTCATGRDGHECYAPCTLHGLRALEYDYWALGHVHERELLCQDPPIVFAGNTQGRHIRETGPKGCTLVTVQDTNRVSLQSCELDVVRWERCVVDASQAADGHDVVRRFEEHVRFLLDRAQDRPLIVRVSVEGPCRAHETLAGNPQRWINEIRARALDAGGGRVWIEKIKLCTSLPRGPDPAEWADGPIGELVRYIEELQTDETALAGLEAELADLTKKLPPELKDGLDATDLTSPNALREVLGQVRPLLMARLLAVGQAP